MSKEFCWAITLYSLLNCYFTREYHQNPEHVKRFGILVGTRDWNDWSRLRLVTNFENSLEVCARYSRHLTEFHTSQFSETARNFHHVGGLISLAPIRHRRQIWTISLNQQTIQRNFRGNGP